MTNEKQDRPLANPLDRAPNGTFLPGHTPLAFGGARPNSGPKPSLKTRLKRFEEKHPDAYDELMEILYEKGLNGDSQDAQYVVDRLKGKPKVTMGIDEVDANLITIATLMKFRQLKEANKTIEGEFKEIPENATEP